MSTLLTRSFTAADGTNITHPSVGFALAEGAAIAALVISNQGGAGAGGARRIFRSLARPGGLANYIARLDAIWADAATVNRTIELWARMSDDASWGYCLELESNTGSPQWRLRRRADGTYTTLVDWTAVVVDLEAATTLELRLQDPDPDTVNVKVMINGTEEDDVDDTSAVRVSSGGSVGFAFGASCDVDDVLVDNLRALDFEEEHADPPALTEGLALSIDGTWHSEAEWKALGISIESVRQSYEDSVAVSLRDTNALTAPALYSGAWIEVRLNDTVLAVGRLRPKVDGLTPAQGHTYEVDDLKTLARSVIIDHPVTHAGQIVYNAEETDPGYDPDLLEHAAGDAITDVIDKHLDGEGQLREIGAAPSEGPAYESSEIAGEGPEMPAMRAAGDVIASVEGFLGFTRLDLFIDPANRQWRFRNRQAAAVREVDAGVDHVLGQVSTDPAGAYTAVLVRGSRRELERLSFDDLETVPGQGLDDDWDVSEDDWKPTEMFKNKESGEVDAFGVDTGQLYVEPDFDMVSHEWSEPNESVLVFTSGAEDGNSYDVDDCTPDRITLVLGAWQSGGPSAGDTFYVEGNGKPKVLRQFALPAGKRIPPGSCVKAYIHHAGDKVPVGVEVVDHPADSDSGAQQKLQLELPAIGLFNFAPGSTPDPCTEGEHVRADRVEIEAPVYDVTTTEAPWLLHPPVGRYGPAYAKDPAKWSGGGKAGYGDPKVMAVYPIDVQAYVSTDQDPIMQELAEEILEKTSALPISATLEIAGLDETWAGLDFRVSITRTGGSMGDLETIDVPVIAVEWRPLDRKTVVYLGTTRGEGGDLGAMRDRHAQRLQKAQVTTLLEVLRQQAACVADMLHGRNTASVDPTPVCSDRVYLPGGQSVTQHAEAHAPSDQSCQSGTVGSPNCTGTLCGTLDGSALTNLLNIKSQLEALHVIDSQPESFASRTTENILGELSVPPGEKGGKILDVVCCLAESLAAVVTFLASWAASVDTELGRGGTDLQNLKLCYDGLLIDLAAKWAQIDTCFSNKVNGDGDPCGLVPFECGWSPLMCEDPCAASAPNVTCTFATAP